MDPIAYLRAALSAAGAVTPADGGKLPPSELRFTLELKQPGDAAGLKARIASALSDDRFLVEPLDVGQATAGLFHVLRFPTLDRVFAQHDLFDIAYALADALDLASCEPELGADVFRDPPPPGNAPVVESSMLGSLCWADGEPPDDPLWALKHAKLDIAHQSARGKGILVGQPDTGITDHDELAGGMFDMDRAADIMDGDNDPTDTLSDGMANPGHGTSTSSVLASRGAGRVTGAAPEALVVPIRCIEDVKVFNTAPVAAAITHAVQCGCHVISMSLGGLKGRAMHAAIRDAVARDVIVVAASGNCIGIVVWPARYPEVIAAGGIGPANRPWKGSSRGSSVTLSAPAEFVWRAERTTHDADKALVSASQGTSYATAIIAGAAAVWLSKHGRDAVIQEAHQRGITVAKLCATALKVTSFAPEDWDTDYGAGILDAEQLVNLRLADIPQAQAEAATPGEGEREREWFEEMLLEQFGPTARDATFDSRRYEAELSAIALSQAKFDKSLAHLTPEAKSEGTLPSERLRKAVDGSPDPRLRRFGLSAHGSVSMPLLPTPLDDDIARAALLLPAGTIAETASGADTIDAMRGHLGGAAGDKLRSDVQQIIEQASASVYHKKRTLASVDAFMKDMKDVGAIRTPEARIGLEALILMKGRPALRVRGGDVDEKDPRAEQWEFPIYTVKANSRFAQRVGAVGRIDYNGVHVGTGWVVGEGLVLTNRHVLQGIAYPTPKKNKPAQWILKNGFCTIDFAETPSSQTQASKFGIVSVAEAGPQDIDLDAIDLRKPDFALLRVKVRNVGGTESLPMAFELSLAKGYIDPGQRMAVVGYPAQMSKMPRNDKGEVDQEGLARLQALFAADYGTKYFSPGYLNAPKNFDPTKIPHTSTHDATTLGGNSGSLIASFNAPMKAVGLHFAGAWRRENYAHSVVELKAMGYLADPGIHWVE